MPQVSDLIDAFMIEGMTDQQKIDLLDYLGQDAIVSAAGEKFNSLDTAIDSKLNSSDVVDDLMTSDSSKALSAGQGVALKGQVDGLTPPAVATESNLYAMTGLTAGDLFMVADDNNSIREFRGDVTALQHSSLLVTTDMVTNDADAFPLAGVYSFHKNAEAEEFSTGVYLSRLIKSPTTGAEKRFFLQEFGTGFFAILASYTAGGHVTQVAHTTSDRDFSNLPTTGWDLNKATGSGNVTVTRPPELTQSNWINRTTNTINTRCVESRQWLTNLHDGVLVYIEEGKGLERFDAMSEFTDPVGVEGVDLTAYPNMKNLIYVFTGVDGSSDYSADRGTKNIYLFVNPTWQFFDYPTFDTPYTNPSTDFSTIPTTGWTRTSDSSPVNLTFTRLPAANAFRWSSVSPVIHKEDLAASLLINNTTTLTDVFTPVELEKNATYRIQVVVRFRTPHLNAGAEKSIKFHTGYMNLARVGDRRMHVYGTSGELLTALNIAPNATRLFDYSEGTWYTCDMDCTITTDARGSAAAGGDLRFKFQMAPLAVDSDSLQIFKDAELTITKL